MKEKYGSPSEKSDRLLLDIAETCRALSCSRSLIYALIKSGEIQPVKLGRATRLRVADLERLIGRRAS